MTAKKTNNSHESIVILKEQTDRLIRLVSSMLDITRLRANRAIFKQEEVDIMECIYTVVKSIENTAPLHHVKVSGNTQRKIRGDRDRICQILSNLLTNAIKYSPRGGMIAIMVREDKNDIEVAVQDNGIGIDRADQKKIFDRFYRVSDTNESTFSGLGIGLYLTAEIIKKHKGKIWVESEKGKGSTFYFRLPMI